MPMKDMAATVAIRPAGEIDLPFIVRIERLPGYEELTARWTHEEHSAAYRRPDTRYLIGHDGAGKPFGFVILQPFDDLHEGTKIKRIAVEQPGYGFGRALMAEALSWVFQRAKTPRVWLDVFAHNSRAIAAYRAVGMRTDGVLRAAYQLPDGRRVDRHLMSLLRDEWPPA
jgi:RimJ/RimL family protein N-acetyltransferase